MSDEDMTQGEWNDIMLLSRKSRLTISKSCTKLLCSFVKENSRLLICFVVHKLLGTQSWFAFFWCNYIPVIVGDLVNGIITELDLPYRFTRNYWLYKIKLGTDMYKRISWDPTSLLFWKILSRFILWLEFSEKFREFGTKIADTGSTNFQAWTPWLPGESRARKHRTLQS